VVPEKVVEFLRANKGVDFCDDCISKQLSLKRRQQVQAVTATLALGSGYTRKAGFCPACKAKREKLLIRSN